METMMRLHSRSLIVIILVVALVSATLLVLLLLGTFNIHVVHIPVGQIALNPTGDTLAAATAEGIEFRTFPDLRITRTLDSESHNVIAWNYDGKLIATNGKNYAIQLWNTENGNLEMTLAGANTPTDAVAFSPDGRYIAATGRASVLYVWEVRTGQLFRSIKHFAPFISSLAFSPTGQYLASGNAVTKLWSFPTTEPINLPFGKGDDINTVVFNKDGTLLASGNSDGYINIWSMPQGDLLHSIKSHKGSVSAIAFSPDGQYIAAGGGMTYQQGLGEIDVKVWNVATEKVAKIFSGHRNAVNSVVFSPDGQTITISSDDGTIRQWSLN